jgi:hypothetical protein
VETISWKWNQFWKSTIPGLIFGLIDRLSSSRGLIFGLYLAMVLEMILGMLSGLIGGFTDRVKPGKASQNQGIKLEKFFGCISRYLVDRWVDLRAERRAVIWAVLRTEHRAGCRAKPGWFSRDQTLCVTTDSLAERLCAKLILLKKVGGAYIFVHRMLLEYFADLIPQPARVEDGTTSSK